MTDKLFLRPDDLVRDSFRLGKMVVDSNFTPDALLAVWRGGAQVGAIVHEYLRYRGINPYHIAVKSESYTGIEEKQEPRIEGLTRVLEKLPPDGRVLVVDDIFDSGETMRVLRERLHTRTRHVRVATLYCRIDHAGNNRLPDYRVHDTEKWVVFPHELMNLTPAEIRSKDPAIADLLEL